MILGHTRLVLVAGFIEYTVIVKQERDLGKGLRGKNEKVQVH